eukprot:812701-Prymnesium_polylepis.1
MEGGGVRGGAPAGFGAEPRRMFLRFVLRNSIFHHSPISAIISAQHEESSRRRRRAVEQSSYSCAL